MKNMLKRLKQLYGNVIIGFIAVCTLMLIWGVREFITTGDLGVMMLAGAPFMLSVIILMIDHLINE